MQKRPTLNEGNRMKSVPDEDVMLQVRNGEVEMLGVLFDRYQAPLFNFYSKMTQDRTVSEDLVQEVFLRILRYRQTYRPNTTFRTWMYQIARNTRLDQVRKVRPETHVRGGASRSYATDRFRTTTAGSRHASARPDAATRRQTRNPDP